MSLMAQVASPALEHQLEQHRSELVGYCYRMLGSPFEAEDAVQDTFLRAWRGFDRFEGRAAFRSWLYRIATNVCLDMLNGRNRRARPMDFGPAVEPVESNLNTLPEVTFIEPIPTSLVSAESDPAELAVQRDTIRLAFVAALQHLPARQRAVLILCEVLGYQASDVADMLDSSVGSVSSALKRARASLHRRLPPAGEPPPASDSPAEQELVARFVRAYRSGDVEALVALLTDDVHVSMPPIPLEYHGRDAVARFHASFLRPDRTFDLVATRANGQPAFGAYLRPPAGGSRHGSSLLVLTLTGSRICAITRFESGAFPSLGLPRSLPG
jgi:RNA polymerase sigma-70 factor (ECF subfamily)